MTEASNIINLVQIYLYLDYMCSYYFLYSTFRFVNIYLKQTMI